MTQTVQNLAKAFIGESQARNRYTFYASVAKKEGYEQISEIFRLTADQEKEHASWLLKMIDGLKKDSQEPMDEIMVEAGMPTIKGTTAENLKAAIGGENHEHTSMYPEFAKVAKEEGYEEIAERLLSIARAEQHHEERYSKLLKELEGGTLFRKDQEVAWVCRECGYEHVGKEAPLVCPSCSHPQGYYQVKCEQF